MMYKIYNTNASEDSLREGKRQGQKKKEAGNYRSMQMSERQQKIHRRDAENAEGAQRIQ
jgi:hypothetical protein